MQEWNELKLPEALPGNSGGRLAGRSTKEEGREEEKAEEECMKLFKKWLWISRKR